MSSGALLLSSPVWAQYSPTPAFTGHLGKTVQESQTVYRAFNPQAKKGAPNVVWILIDDMGFGATSPFGGLIDTPTFDYLAQKGLRFNNFHTTSISAPTRAALLTGRNHHSSHVGKFNTDTYGAPGYDSHIPLENGTVAEVLRENGYATFAVGKYNATPLSDGTNAGPFNRWPTGRGFDHYYGYHPVVPADKQWHPQLYRDTQRIPDDSLGQLAITRFANEAINFIADQKNAAPEQPFFLYFAPGTAHVPFQTTPEWINKYKGKFSQGWDEYAEQVFTNQIRRGIIPKNTKKPVRNKEWDQWKALSQDERTVFARQMETYAGFVSQADYEIGRIVKFLEEIGQLDNTVIFLMLGDNGAECTGRKIGCQGVSYDLALKDSVIRQELKDLEHLGDESSYPFYSEGWAAATSTPFRYYKGYADYEGGTHNGLIVFYPNGIKEQGAIRSQYTHVSDVLPTTVNLTQSTVPTVINGYPQTPLDGTSFAYAIESPNDDIASRKHVQYYELAGSYAIYKDGWKAQFPNDSLSAARRRRGDLDHTPHLYHIANDFNESTDLAKKYPEKLKELSEVFDEEAQKYNVYPIKGNTYKDPSAPKNTRRHFDLYLGARDYAEYPYFNAAKGKHWILSSYIETSPDKKDGVLISQNKFSFYLKDGVPVYAFQTFFEIRKVVGAKSVPDGQAKVTADLIQQQNGDVVVTLFINDEEVGKANLGNIELGIPHSRYALEIGRQWGYPPTDDYQSPNIFRGKYKKATVDIIK